MAREHLRTQRVYRAGELLMKIFVKLDFKQQIRATLKVEAQANGLVRKCCGPVFALLLGKQVGHREQNE